MSTAIVTSDTSEDHITGDGHPEQPKRVSAVVNKLKKRKNLLWVKSEKFDPVSYTHLTLPTIDRV